MYSLEHWDVSTLLDKCVVFILPAIYYFIYFLPSFCMLWPYFLSEKHLLLKKQKSSYKKKIRFAFHIFLGWNCVISAKIQRHFEVLLLQKQAILRPLLFLLYYAKYIEIYIWFTLSSFQKEFSFEVKDEGTNKEVDVSLLGNTPKGKYKIHQHFRCVVLYHS